MGNPYGGPESQMGANAYGGTGTNAQGVPLDQGVSSTPPSANSYPLISLGPHGPVQTGWS
jgi:hypothetical protein